MRFWAKLKIKDQFEHSFVFCTSVYISCLFVCLWRDWSENEYITRKIIFFCFSIFQLELVTRENKKCKKTVSNSGNDVIIRNSGL